MVGGGVGEMSCLQNPVARSPTAVSTSPDKAARSRSRRRGGGRTHAKNGGKRPTFQADAWILGRPSQTVNTFLNKSFLLPSGRISSSPYRGIILLLCAHYPSARESKPPRSRGRGRGKASKASSTNRPTLSPPSILSRFVHISMNSSPRKRVTRRYFYSISHFFEGERRAVVDSPKIEK